MKKCTHCQKELSNPRKSAEIPTRTNHHYICCDSCGNVIIAEYKDGAINRLEMTPSSDSQKTKNMIQEAYNLFQVANIGFSSYAIKKDEERKSTRELKATQPSAPEREFSLIEGDESPAIEKKKGLVTKIVVFFKDLFIK